MKPTDVKTARERLKWDQQTLAKKAGIPQSTISRIESGETANPSADTLMALARALRIDPRRLRFGGNHSEAVAP